MCFFSWKICCFCIDGFCSSQVNQTKSPNWINVPSMVVIRGHLNLRNFLPFKPCHLNPCHSKCVHFESSLILHDHDLLCFITLALKREGKPEDTYPFNPLDVPLIGPKKHGRHPHVDGPKNKTHPRTPQNIMGI